MRERLGSSPRVWGQVTNIKGVKRNERIIPTRVGTSCSRMIAYRCVWDHPHACGDKACKHIINAYK